MTTLFISHSSKDREWAEQTRETLRKQGYQSLFLDSHPDDGIHAGFEWEQTLWQKLRQSRGIVVLCTTHWLASPWCVAEAMIARERGKSLFMVRSADVGDAQIPDFLKDRQSISLAEMTETEAQHRLWRGLAAKGLKDDFQQPSQPYPGLKPFEELDAGVFFGRDDEIKKVIDVLRQRRRNNAEGFIVVLGASGCGKSSLVRAGVLPRLRRASGDASSGTAWVIPPPFTAGRGLDNGLALSLASAFENTGQSRKLCTVRGQLGTAGNLRALGGELLLAHGAPEGSVLFVLDQLEEVFDTPEGSEQRVALRLLLDASGDAGSSIVVLATLRSDFLDKFQRFEGAAKRYKEVTLDPMLRSHFSEVIEGPAVRFGLNFDPGLSGRMVDETTYNDALPLLAFTLEELYERCKFHNQLTLKAYDELGGVSSAIQHAADAILEETDYAGLQADDPRMRDLRRAFYSLARVGEGGQFTRRTGLKSQMPASCTDVLKRFVDQRLLVSDVEQNKETLSVAHEALFRVWDTLSGWLREDHKALQLRSQIEDAASVWQAANRDESRMWSEERILSTVSEIEKSGVCLADVKNQEIVEAFLGPTDPKTLEVLPALTAAEDATAGSGRYGEAWRLPLGHEARASVGVRLALLGDRRKGVGLRATDGLPDIDWRPIDRGVVTIEIGANPDDPNSEVVINLAREVEPFWMARYPVTISQFGVFLSECYRDGTWQLHLLPPGFAKVLAEHPEYEPPKHMARHGNHPVDGVNWWDASLFCHWLGKRIGFEVRLPTEYEWQLAATGGDPARAYPWGPGWDHGQEPCRANTFESGLNRSTAVGMYPAGASPGGIEDMAGNVWELCQNAFDEWSHDDRDNTGFPHSSRDLRVLRGGSWIQYLDFARSAYRLRYSPVYRAFNFGFRVVCSSLSPQEPHQGKGREERSASPDSLGQKLHRKAYVEAQIAVSSNTKCTGLSDVGSMSPRLAIPSCVTEVDSLSPSSDRQSDQRNTMTTPNSDQSREQVSNHLRFLGYDTNIDEHNTISARHPDKPNIMVMASSEGALLRTIFSCSDTAKQDRLGYLEFINAANQKTLIARYCAGEDCAIVFAWYSGEYSQIGFGRFLGLWDKELEKLAEIPGVEKYL